MRALSAQDSLDTVFEVVNQAYKIEIGNTGLAFKQFDRLRSVADIVRENIHVALLGSQIVGVVGIELKQDTAALGQSRRKAVTEMLSHVNNLSYGQLQVRWPWCLGYRVKE